MFNLNKARRQICIAILIFALFLNVMPMSADSSHESLPNEKDGAGNAIINDQDVLGYSEYLESYHSKPLADNDLLLLNEEKEFVKQSAIDFDIQINKGALYNLSFVYTGLSREDAEISVYIDGELPFSEAQRILLPTYWKDAGGPRKDGKGNEFAPEQVMVSEYVQGDCRDNTGVFEEPYLFYLEAGSHRITINVITGSLKVRSAYFKSVKEPQDYKTIVDDNDVKNSDGIKDAITIEGEDSFIKSSKSLTPFSDDSNANVHPTNATRALLNYIGGSNWSEPNATIVWKFNVKESGYYRLGFLFRQSRNLGGISYRNLKIDGITPFAEAKAIKFKYTSSWSYMDFSDKEAPYWIYLEAGEHNLSLSVTTGPLTEVYRRIKEITRHMGDIYIDITMVVGETVDIGRSYELFNQIPKFNERLKYAIDELTDITRELEELQEKKGGSVVSIIGNAIHTLEKMYNNPYYAHKYKSAYYSAYTNLSALLGTMTNMPLDIDRIFVIGKGSDFKYHSASIFKRFSFGFKRFIHSFAGDYYQVGDVNHDKQLNLWVNWGRDQTQILDALIQSDFTAKYGIPVKVRLVNASLIQAILSGKGPDLMLQMSRSEPVNLAMRGALHDLKQFDDYYSVIRRFAKDADVPFTYKNGVYALPDTMNFYLMFARTDILSGLNLEIPKTWQDFINVMTILQRNNLQVSLPYTEITDSTTVNVGVGGLTLYPTMLAQNGLSLYSDDLTRSTLTNEPQIRVFSDWVSLYTKYKVPKYMDFYNRFRIGSAPLGIASYTLYTQLKAAAPEIEGRWQTALIPGTVREDGTVNHSSAGSGSGCAITKLSKNPVNAWTFLKWWTSAETQLKYSDNLEALLGPLGRVASANLEALNNMVWDDEMLEVINEQVSYIVQIPEIPGGYYTARGIDQAFWNVVEQNENPTDMMLEWGAIVDNEIARKRLEYD